MLTIKKNYKEDLKLLVDLGEKYEEGTPFRLIFKSGALCQSQFVCEFIDGEYRHCDPVDATHVECILDNHGLMCGMLEVEIYIWADDPQMPDGNFRFVTKKSVEGIAKNGKTYPIELINGKSDLCCLSELAVELLEGLLRGKKGDKGDDGDNALGYSVSPYIVNLSNTGSTMAQNNIVYVSFFDGQAKDTKVTLSRLEYDPNVMSVSGTLTDGLLILSVQLRSGKNKNSTAIKVYIVRESVESFIPVVPSFVSNGKDGQDGQDGRSTITWTLLSQPVEVDGMLVIGISEFRKKGNEPVNVIAGDFATIGTKTYEVTSFSYGMAVLEFVSDNKGADGSILFPTVRVDAAGYLIADIPDEGDGTNLSIDNEGYLCVDYPDIN